MGQKISPISFRIVISKDWKSRWFSVKHYKEFLKEDLAIRALLQKKLKGMSVDRVTIERSPDTLAVVITTARPGLIIGRAGTGIEELKKIVQRMVKRPAQASGSSKTRKAAVKLDVQEIKNPETSAAIMAESMIEQVEKRIQYRRILKQTLAKIIANRNVKGAKVLLTGRLDGNEIARTEHLEEGSLPLQTLRADIDFARATAFTTFGTVGAKVWIYKGMKYATTETH